MLFSGNCVCRAIYKEGPFDKKCYPSISGDCNSNYDCIATGDNNAVCVQNKCRCKANFKYDESSEVCLSFACSIKLDCNEYDNNRYCKDGKCLCIDGYVESSADNMCIISDNGGLSWWFITGIVVVSIVLFGISCYYCCKRCCRRFSYLKL